MSTKYQLAAEMREDLGKGASRRLRRQSLIPAILYGAGRPAWSLSLKENQLVRNLQEESFYASIIELTFEGKPQKVFMKDLQRHPAKDLILHVDLMRVRDDVEMVLTLPIHLLNDETSVGIKAGGILMRTMADIEISCLPANLPEFIELDIAELELGSALHISDIKFPEGVVSTIMAQGAIDAENNDDFDIHSVDQSVVSIVVPKAEKEVEEGAPETPDAPESDTAADDDAGDDSSED